jgi:hypothetical protein
VRRCLGACCGKEDPGSHWQRLCTAIAPLALPAWPFDGPIDLVERDPATGREAVCTVDQWRLVGADGSAGEFDHEVLRILRPYVEGRKRNRTVTLERNIRHLKKEMANLGTE